jgi:hypothetical protein
LNKDSEAGKYAFLFKREYEGVYMFGSKRIWIKIENEKLYGKCIPWIIFIARVGGGFVKMDEFLSSYGPIELPKFTKS